jgi:hypothetical protein
VKKAARRALGLGVVAGAMYGVWRAYRARAVSVGPDTAAGQTTWQAAPFPFPPIPRPATARVPVATEVEAEVDLTAEPDTEPDADAGTDADDDGEAVTDSVDGACPASHPVKGKLTSGIYHQPGGLNYTRTNADRCYLDPSAAEAEGLRPAKL